MHSVLSCLVTDVIGPAAIADDLVAAIAGELGHEGGCALREYVRAIDLVIQALGLRPSDRVVISPLAPAAYRHAFVSRGLIPVFADVREEDACIDPSSVQRILDEGQEIVVRALFVHAPLGRIPDMDALEAFGIPLVVDIGEALGATDGKASIGIRGQYVLLPMETDGIATSGGGTLVFAKEKSALTALDAAAGLLTPDAFLPDLNASLGLVQWREYPHALEARDSIAEAYRQALMKGRHRTFPDGGDDARSVAFSFPVVLSSSMNEVIKYARKKGIETLPAFFGRMMEGYPDVEVDCPKARLLSLCTLLFPLYPTLGKQNVQLIAKVLSTLP